MSKYEVTQKIWEHVMGDNSSQFRGTRLPVEKVSWLDAVQFCNKASILDGLQPAYEIMENNVTCNFKADGYRLPTEAEWEYAAKGGKNHETYIYSGNDYEDEVAWYRTDETDQTRAVGRKSPNSLKLYDMSGNVWEWCWDWYTADYYENPKSLENPIGPDKGKKKVIRGGSWFVKPEFCRVTNRASRIPDKPLSSDGFRIVKSHVPEEID